MTDAHIHIPHLETERLTLRAPRMSDIPAFADYRASERSRTVGGPFARSTAMKEIAAIAGHWHLRGYGRWMIADRSTDAPIGVAGPYFPDDWPEPEIAWTVFEGAEGKGIAFEAATVALDYAFSTLGWRTAISLVGHDNERSRALALRLGAELEGDFAHPVYGDMQVFRHPAPGAAA